MIKGGYMGITIRLEGEQGNEHERVDDPHRLLLSLMKEMDVSQTCCLRFIDPYGNTVFNRLQMPQLLTEIASLHKLVKRVEQNEVINEFEKLALRCSKEPHLYIKIYGD